VAEGTEGASRVLAIDLGRKRIGLALSDAEGLSAQPLDALQRRSPADDIARICSVARDRKVRRIIVGLPLHMDGRESPMSEECRRFAARLAEASGLPVDLHDERLTSVEAEEMLKARGWSLDRLLKEKKKGTVDRLAATVLLEDWMSSIHAVEGGE
jgi:putative holliday junction resolvase